MRVAVGEICQVYLHAHQFPARQHCSRIRSCCCLGVSVESSMSKANVDQGPALKRLRPDPGGGPAGSGAAQNAKPAPPVAPIFLRGLQRQQQQQKGTGSTPTVVDLTQQPDQPEQGQGYSKDPAPVQPSGGPSCLAPRGSVSLTPESLPRVDLTGSWDGTKELVSPGRIDLGSGSYLLYYPGHFRRQSKEMQAWLQAPGNINWKRERNRLGQEHRDTAYYGTDPSLGLTYSGRSISASLMPDKLQEMMGEAGRLAGARFNTVLLNWYKDGTDHVGWHADNEKLYGPTAFIASVTFGMTRPFVMRRSCDHNCKLVLNLSGGDLLVMAGTTQRFWEHCVPKRARLAGGRINLTFRQVVNAQAKGTWKMEQSTAQAGKEGTQLAPPGGA